VRSWRGGIGGDKEEVEAPVEGEKEEEGEEIIGGSLVSRDGNG